MTSDWIVGNLWAWSLHAAAMAGALAVCLAVFRVRAPLPRLRLLQYWLMAACTLPPVGSLAEHWRGDLRRASPVRLEERIDIGMASSPVAAPATVPWTDLFVAIWIGGAALRAGWLVIGYRRLRRQTTVAPSAAIEQEIEELRNLLSAGGGLAAAMWRARFEWCTGLTQPGTVGLLPPRVLLPATLLDQDPVKRRAIVCHELIHVRRADWHAVLIEELARTLFWFHPGIRWVVAEVRIAREQVVDQEVVERLGHRQTYLNLLYDFAAESPTLAGAAPFFGRRQLERRVTSLLSEVRMSRLHRFAASLLTLALAGAAVGVASYWYPLDLIARTAPQSAQEADGSPGPLERVATQIAGKDRLPRRVHVTPFVFPAEARGALASGLVTVRLVVDNTGTVAEARVLRTRMTWKGASTAADRERITNLIAERSLGTVREWRYEQPPSAVVWTMTVFYNDDPTAKASDEPAAGSSAPAGSPLRVGGDVRPPAKVVNIAPTYPPEALSAGVQGVVAIEATIDESGNVTEARVLKSVPELDDAALEAVRQWRYTPTLMNGTAVPVIMTVTISFTLPGQDR